MQYFVDHMQEIAEELRTIDPSNAVWYKRITDIQTIVEKSMNRQRAMPIQKPDFSRYVRCPTRKIKIQDMKKGE